MGKRKEKLRERCYVLPTFTGNTGIRREGKSKSKEEKKRDRE